MSVNSTVLILLIVFSSPAVAQENNAVRLDKRTESEYLKSGYSFRYRTSNIANHKNNVDLVYEAGRMRINNHGDLKCRIADLGELADFETAAKIKKSDAKWSQELLEPVVGKIYALEIKVDHHEMTALIQVKKVREEILEFAWKPVSAGKWPIDINSRAENGTSGMMAQPRARKSYRKSPGEGR